MRMLAYRYEAEKRRPPASIEKRSSFLRLISIGANPRASFRPGSGWPGPVAVDLWAADRKQVASRVVRLSPREAQNRVSFIRGTNAVETCSGEHVAKIDRTPNKPLHPTRRGGVLASRAVVEARLAGERQGGLK